MNVVALEQAGATTPADELVVQARAAVERVCDPEIPTLTIADLGVLRDVRNDDGCAVVVITPTYSGCPAMDTIADDIRTALNEAGIGEHRIETVLSPAWTTDWLSEQGREKLLAQGIAPPVGRAQGKRALLGAGEAVTCPRCGGRDTQVISEFGSTACKALYRCQSCLEPFDYFKCL